MLVLLRFSVCFLDAFQQLAISTPPLPVRRTCCGPRSTGRRMTPRSPTHAASPQPEQEESERAMTKLACRNKFQTHGRVLEEMKYLVTVGLRACPRLSPYYNYKTRTRDTTFIFHTIKTPFSTFHFIFCLDKTISLFPLKTEQTESNSVSE